MRKTSLVVMAAGIGSRFGGGIKQLTPVGAHREIIMDYSIYDAIEAGFNKIVFIIRKDLEKDFEEILGTRIRRVCARQGVEVCYVYQEQDQLPEGVQAPEGRTKPWGTTHAIWCCRNCVQEPFAVINADDYYGKQAYGAVHDYLVTVAGAHDYCMAGFILKNTLSDVGAVTRGLCRENEEHELTEIVETKNILKTPCGAEANGVALDAEGRVSMNMWGFSPAVFPMLEQSIRDYFAQEKEQILNGEVLLPICVGDYIQDKSCRVRVLPTEDSWFGMTYQEDVPAVRESIARMTAAGDYPSPLFER